MLIVTVKSFAAILAPNTIWVKNNNAMTENIARADNDAFLIQRLRLAGKRSLIPRIHPAVRQTRQREITLARTPMRDAPRRAKQIIVKMNTNMRGKLKRLARINNNMLARH